jgi:hypothetical protein
MSTIDDKARELADEVLRSGKTHGTIVFGVQGKASQKVWITFQVGDTTVILNKSMIKEGEFVQFHGPNTCQCCGR